MPADLTKKAVEMLLKGATLLSEPCPYCKGVRVMMDGNALCVNCGKEPEKQVIEPIEKKEEKPSTTIEILEKKLQTLSKELEQEKDHEKQEKILKSINSLIETITKLKKN
ncbi:MAG TPA: Sjogren's syndrome/scleroderma autoantigen 1 family protein [Nitrosopumilaceae archaeon]|nr:Sjogren's syndrome/scleroderma autoantigen 1 family protein [Nitrosopumilaceae archaeon]